MKEKRAEELEQPLRSLAATATRARLAQILTPRVFFSLGRRVRRRTWGRRGRGRGSCEDIHSLEDMHRRSAPALLELHSDRQRTRETEARRSN